MLGAGAKAAGWGTVGGGGSGTPGVMLAGMYGMAGAAMDADEGGGTNDEGAGAAVWLPGGGKDSGSPELDSSCGIPKTSGLCPAWAGGCKIMRELPIC